MRIEPIGDKIVVKRLDSESKTAGGIVLPDTAKEKPQQGRVLSVGSGRVSNAGVRNPPQVAEGDRVLFSTYAGMEIKIDGNELLILSEDEILAIID
jgi:chaperonin GroES